MRALGLLALAWAIVAPAPIFAQYTNKVTTTPVLIQDGFGFGGRKLPNDGLAYCGPTAMSMSVEWLGINGWTQLSPKNPTLADGLNLDRILAGMMQTTGLGGTTSNANFMVGLQTYLSAKGIDPTGYAFSAYNAPSVASIAALNRNQTVVTTLMGWYQYDSGAGQYDRVGGHFVATLTQDPSRQVITINNPAPSSLVPSPDLRPYGLQSLHTLPFNGTSPDLPGPGKYIQWDPNQYGGYLGSTTAIIETVFALTLNPNRRPGAGWTPAPWVLTQQQAINTNGGDLSVLAPLQGAGGLFKTGLGTLTIAGANTTTGANLIAGGAVLSSQGSGTPLGAGDLGLNYGTLALQPGGKGAVVQLSLASGADRRFTYGGGGVLEFSRGANASLDLRIGGYADGSHANLERIGFGTLVIAPGGGTSGLGGVEKVRVSGVGGNLPTTNGIVTPSIVGRDNDANRSGDFLAYGANGFAKAAYVRSTNVAINAAAPTSVYEVNDAQTLAAGSTASVFALKVGAFAIASGGGTTTLQVGDGFGGMGLGAGAAPVGAVGGVILNGGAIKASALSFGAGQGLVYASKAGGTISSDIQGSGGLVTFGPGILKLQGASTYSGGTNIQSGTVAAMNASGSATGVGEVIIHQEAALRIEAGASVGGHVFAQGGGFLAMAGGAAAGGVSVDFASTLTGYGTIRGAATVNGAIQAGQTIGQLEFTDSVTFNGPADAAQNVIFSWTLGRLTDDPAQAGIDWNTLLFSTRTGTLYIGNQNMGVAVDLDFSRVADPNTADPFWTKAHAWTLFTAPYRFNELYYSLQSPAFAAGYFGMTVDADFTTMSLTYTPVERQVHRFSAASVPEPATLLMGAFGLAGAGWTMRRRRR